jgi:hypothetical protein
VSPAVQDPGVVVVEEAELGKPRLLSEEWIDGREVIIGTGTSTGKVSVLA